MPAYSVSSPKIKSPKKEEKPVEPKSETSEDYKKMAEKVKQIESQNSKLEHQVVLLTQTLAHT